MLSALSSVKNWFPSILMMYPAVPLEYVFSVWLSLESVLTMISTPVITESSTETFWLESLLM